MNDIFKDMQAKVGCDYISDLPFYKRKVWQEMKRLNPADYEERQLEDFSKYVFGMSYQTLKDVMKQQKGREEQCRNHFSRHSGKGVRLMKPSDFQKTVQCRFESCLKKVVRHVVKDYQQKLKRRQEKETLFCELPEIVVENLAVWDDYDTDYTIFNVCGNDIRVYDDELAEALKQLSERNRETLLMYYFLEMNNEEIAKKQNISRSGVFQNRHNSLALMKKLLKEKQ